MGAGLGFSTLREYSRHFADKRGKPRTISGGIFQKVLAEIVQKGLILSQKRLISNRCNFGLLAPKSMRFPSKDRKSKDRSFQLQKVFTSDFFSSRKTRMKLRTVA